MYPNFLLQVFLYPNMWGAYCSSCLLFFLEWNYYRVKSDLMADLWVGGYKARDLAASCNRSGNMICIYSPECCAPKIEGASTEKQWIGGKDLFSFSVLGSSYKSTHRLSEMLGFAGTLSKIKSQLSTHFKHQIGFSHPLLSTRTSVNEDRILACYVHRRKLFLDV